MSNPIGDRNLLMGILAWQKQFIRADALAAALNAWTLAKQKGLAQILREQRVLTENQHALLEEATYAHLARHGNDVAKSLADLGDVEPVKQELAKIADADVQVSLAQVVRAEPAAELAPAEEIIEIEAAPTKKPTPMKPAARESAAPPPATKSAPGSGVLAWLACGVIVVGSALCCVALPIGLAVVWMGDKPTVAQGKSDADPQPPNRKADAPVPVKQEVKPDGPLAVVELAPVERQPTVVIGDPAGTKPAPSAGGFVPLFNGKDLTGWQPHAQQPGDWRVVNGILTGFARGNGHLFTTRGDFRDFHLRVEARAKDGKAGGVRFRYGQNLVGYETTVNARSGGVIHIRQIGARVRNLGQLISLPANAWTTVEIIAQGGHLQLKINGKTTAEAVEENAFTAGHIVLYDFNESIEFRTIEIKEFAPAPVPDVAGDFTPLFNGKDLTGWKIHYGAAADWRIDNGILIGAANDKSLVRLVTEMKAPKDFHLRAEMRRHDTGHIGMLFRSANKLHGYEATLPSNNLKMGVNAGGLTVHTNGRGAPLPRLGVALVRPGDWFTLEIIARGERLIVKANGKVRTDTIDATHRDAGYIVLSLGPPSSLEIRKLEIKELKADAPVER